MMLKRKAHIIQPNNMTETLQVFKACQDVTQQTISRYLIILAH